MLRDSAFKSISRPKKAGREMLPFEWWEGRWAGLHHGQGIVSAEIAALSSSFLFDNRRSGVPSLKNAFCFMLAHLTGSSSQALPLSLIATATLFVGAGAVRGKPAGRDAGRVDCAGIPPVWFLRPSSSLCLVD